MVFCFVGVWLLWRWLYRVHDFCGGLVERTRRGTRRHHFFLCALGCCCGCFVQGLGGLAESLSWWSSAVYFERLVECGNTHSSHHCCMAFDDDFGLDFWPCVFVSGCLNHGHGETQLAARSVGLWHQCVYRYFCVGPNCGSRGGGLDCRW